MTMQTARDTPTPSRARNALPAGIVADDLTGATDSAVQFARDGWAARLALTVPSAASATPGSVVAVVTDARALGDDAARQATETAVTSLLASGASRLFVKIDSTMRGSVSAQLEGALAAWSVAHGSAVAIVCSAYPAMGRTIEDGHILVNGQGVHETSVGTDPVTPVATSDLRVLLPGSAHVSVASGSGASLSAEIGSAIDAAIATGARIITVDATTDADLAHLARAIEQLGDRAIPVGAAGLAVAMSHVWAKPAPRRVVVVVSSLHDISRTQADYLREHFETSSGAPRARFISPTLSEALQPAAMPEWAAAQVADGTPLPELVVISSPFERPSEAPDEAGAGADAAGSTAEATASELVADTLAAITYRVLEHSPVDALVLLGGEGARAVLAKLGAKALLVHDTIREGIPVGLIEGGSADGVTVVTKAGGFGGTSTVLEIVTELIDPAGSSTREGLVQ